MAKLKKELSLLTATFYGIGIILGAGIYALIGQGAAIAGNAIWLSFAVAAIVAAFTGLSYAELSGMFSKDAAEYVYTKNAFRKNYLSFLVQWIMIFTLIVSSATVALGFGGYFSFLTGIPVIVAAAGLLLILTLVNYAGIKESARFNIISTFVEAGGLVIVIAIGIFYIGKPGIDYFQSNGIGSIFSATALIFFAYIGFEELVNLSEETKDASRVIPKALVLSLAISTVLYILVSLSAISIIGADALAKSQAPMADTVSRVIPQGGFLMAIIALFATANTALVMLIAASRMIYGLSRNNSLPKSLGMVGKRGTPYLAVFIVMVLTMIFLTVGGIGTIALLTDVGLFVVYIFINASLIKLRYTRKRGKTFRSPINIGRFPVLALAGIVSSILMLFHFDPLLILAEICVVILGFAVFKLYQSQKFGSPKRKKIRKKAF